VGALLGLSAWFLIVSQLRNEGADEFLEMVAALAEAPEEPGEPETEPETDAEVIPG